MSSEADFKFIMGTVLGQKEDSPLSLALANDAITDLLFLTGLEDKDIDRLKWQDPSFVPVKDSKGKHGPLPPPVDLGTGLKQLVRIFKAFVYTKHIEGNPIHDDWQNKTKKAEFDQFRTIGYTQYVLSVPVPRALAAPASSTSGPTPYQRDRVSEFKKGSNQA
jgi:hypothetical protein